MVIHGRGEPRPERDYTFSKVVWDFTGAPAGEGPLLVLVAAFLYQLIVRPFVAVAAYVRSRRRRD